jgi:radical SAM superfamily enzyme with C-terminal helix-hairpin-helix motif
MLKVVIFDGYIDEPTCLGVPPFISPYPRYIAGGIWSYNKKIDIKYITIDQIRKDKNIKIILKKSDIIFIIAGSAVPGKYLSSYPASPQEIIKIFQNIKKSIKILCGPAAKYGFTISSGKNLRKFLSKSDLFDLKIKGDCEVLISEIIKYKNDLDKVNISKNRKNSHEIFNYSIIGSKIVKQHPNYKHQLITEIETYRGCSRSIVGGCSFCCESLKGLPDFRPIPDIINEINQLYINGIRHFRIGGQPCIFSYMSKESSEKEFPKPDPNSLLKLFKGIRNKAPNLYTLHIDNANPGIISRYPKECKEIAKIIIKYHTSGDVAALGVESVDPIVIKHNNLKANSNDVLNAIKLFNRIGSTIGKNGMPELLPGLNFLFGLKGETNETYKINYEFLKKIVNKNLIIRRLNIRQVIPIPGTPLYNIGNKIIRKHKKEFKKFKNIIKNNIEMPILKKMLPIGNIIRDVYTELNIGNITYGRQMGSYPLLIKIPGKHPLHTKINVKLINHGSRSIIALPFPVDINKSNSITIRAIPGIGRKRLNRILLKRPFTSKDEFINSLDDKKIADKLIEYIKIN